MAWMLNKTAYNWVLAQMRAGRVDYGEWNDDKAWQSIPDEPQGRDEYADKCFLAVNLDVWETCKWNFIWIISVGLSPDIHQILLKLYISQKIFLKTVSI